MADDTPTPPQPDPIGPEGGAQPQFSVLAQYMKDLSVENPNAPQVFQYKGQPKVDLNYELEVAGVSEDVYEVAIKIQAGVKSDDGQHFLIDLTYAGLFGVRGFSQEQVQPLLMIEAPRMIFPFARQTVMNASSDCGAPPLMLEPIDFAAQYIANMQQAAQQQGDTAPVDPAPAPQPGKEDAQG